MKKVSSCFDCWAGRTVAFAQLKQESNKNAFIREASVNAYLQHPGIVPVYDLDTHANPPWFTMKFIEGLNLKEFVSQSPELNQKLSVFEKICDVLSYSHYKGILHMDLKPENVAVDKYGEVLLCDWGINYFYMGDGSGDSSPMDSELSTIFRLQSFMETGMVCGTPGYMSPEQEQAQKEKFSPATDVYALGALLFLLLNNEEYQKNPKFKEDIPPGLKAICQKALKPEINDRYQSVEDIIQELSLLKAGFAAKAQPVNLLHLLKLFYSRNKLTMNITSLALIIIFFLIAASYQSIKKERNLVQQKHSSLIKEQQAKMVANTIAADRYCKSAIELLKAGHFDESLLCVDSGLLLNNNNQELLKIKSLFEFSELNFKQANLISENLKIDRKIDLEKYEQIKKLAEKKDQLLFHFFPKFIKKMASSTSDPALTKRLVVDYISFVNKKTNLNIDLSDYKDGYALKIYSPLERFETILPHKITALSIKNCRLDAIKGSFENLLVLDLRKNRILTLRDFRAPKLLFMDLSKGWYNSLGSLMNFPKIEVVDLRMIRTGFLLGFSKHQNLKEVWFDEKRITKNLEKELQGSFKIIKNNKKISYPDFAKPLGWHVGHSN